MSLSQTLTDNCEEMGSKIELLNNSKELGERSPRLNTQNFFLRVGKPGKLFLQPNYTAFTKTSLGTIPSKIEKTLLKTETNIPLTTSINNSLASTESKFNSSTTNNSTMSFGNTYNNSKSFNRKGYGNGFVSKVERFSKYLKEYTPGPGDYYSDKLYTVENDVKRSYFGKSFFVEKRNKSLNLLNPATSNEQKFYTSQERENLLKKKDKDAESKEKDSKSKEDKNSQKGNYYFESKSKRFFGSVFSNKNKYPGPGKYFTNLEYKIRDIDKNSPNFIYPAQKVINPVMYYDLNSNDGKDIGFGIKNKIKNAKVATYWGGVPHLGHTYDFGDTITGKEKKFKKSQNLGEQNVVSIPDFDVIKTIRRNKFFRTKQDYLPSISEEKILNSNSMISNLLKFKKKDLFGLAAPRWDQGEYHDNESHFQVPGPAYYDPRIINNKKSFNLNKKDFIYTNSLPYQTVFENEISNK